LRDQVLRLRVGAKRVERNREAADEGGSVDEGAIAVPTM
jgi:hypothetical protein